MTPIGSPVPGSSSGTIDYVAPEQIRGEPATAASDCYALAGVLCECLTGQVPFPRPNEAATLHAHVFGAAAAHHRAHARTCPPRSTT